MHLQELVASGKGNQNLWLRDPCGSNLIFPQIPIVVHPPPNKLMKLTVNHKVPGPGRLVMTPTRASRARVLTSRRAAAELGRKGSWSTTRCLGLNIDDYLY